MSSRCVSSPEICAQRLLTLAFRFPSSTHPRDARSSLFSAYDSRNRSQSPAAGPSTSRPASGGYGYAPYNGGASSSSPAFGAYPGGGGPNSGGTYRAATPNSRGQYSDAVLSELENQNEEQLEGMSAKVKMLKNVSDVFILDSVGDDKGADAGRSSQ